MNKIAVPKEKNKYQPVKEGGVPWRLQVKGSIFMGWGLEPQPVANFIMHDEPDINEDFEDDDPGFKFSMPDDAPPDSGINWSALF
jgi:hypothetical protein